MKSKQPHRGRPKATRISVHALDRIPRVVARLGLPRKLITYRAIAEALTKRSGVRVTAPTVCRFAHDVDPRRADLRRAFGLVPKVEIESCPHCGRAHTSDVCPELKPRGTNGVTPVTVWAHRVRAGAVVLGRSRRCKRRRCGVHFVPVHPKQRYCSLACQARAAKARRKRTNLVRHEVRR